MITTAIIDLSIRAFSLPGKPERAMKTKCDVKQNLQHTYRRKRCLMCLREANLLPAVQKLLSVRMVALYFLFKKFYIDLSVFRFDMSFLGVNEFQVCLV